MNNFKYLQNLDREDSLFLDTIFTQLSMRFRGRTISKEVYDKAVDDFHNILHPAMMHEISEDPDLKDE